MVLLRATPGLQSHRGAEMPDSPGTETVRSKHQQPRLAAVRRVAYEACDSGLLSPELGAGIRRVKGVRRLGVRVGNWLTPFPNGLIGSRPSFRGNRD